MAVAGRTRDASTHPTSSPARATQVMVNWFSPNQPSRRGLPPFTQICTEASSHDNLYPIPGHLGRHTDPAHRWFQCARSLRLPTYWRKKGPADPVVPNVLCRMAIQAPHPRHLGRRSSAVGARLRYLRLWQSGARGKPAQPIGTAIHPRPPATQAQSTRLPSASRRYG